MSCAVVDAGGCGARGCAAAGVKIIGLPLPLPLPLAFGNWSLGWRFARLSNIASSVAVSTSRPMLWKKGARRFAWTLRPALNFSPRGFLVGGSVAPSSSAASVVVVEVVAWPGLSLHGGGLPGCRCLQFKASLGFGGGGLLTSEHSWLQKC